jgi:hypothetical protein
VLKTMSEHRRAAKRACVILLCALCVLAPGGAFAQPTCDIDLSTVASLIVDAQASASSGDVQSALGQIAIAQSLLDDIEANCGAAPLAGAGSPPPTLTPALTATPTAAPLSLETDIDLSAEFAAPDALFTARYPVGWVPTDYEQPPASLTTGGMIAFGASATALARLRGGSSDQSWLPGDPAVQVIVGDAVALLTGIGLYDTAQTLPETLEATAQYAQAQAGGRVNATELQTLEAGERTAYAFAVAIPQSVAWLVFVELDAGRYALVYSVGAGVEGEFLRALSLAMAGALT